MQIERLPQYMPQEIQVIHLVPEQALPAMQLALIDLLQTLPTPLTITSEADMACVGKGRLPHPRFLSSRLRFCPAARIHSPQGSSVSCRCLSRLPCCLAGECIYRWSRTPRTAQARAMRWI